MMEVTEQFRRKQKDLARELRQSRWWKNKIATHACCYFCQKPLNAAEATMDHLHPISEGGQSTKGNVVVSCKECNTRKRANTIVDLALRTI